MIEVYNFLLVVDSYRNLSLSINDRKLYTFYHYSDRNDRPSSTILIRMIIIGNERSSDRLLSLLFTASCDIHFYWCLS